MKSMTRQRFQWIAPYLGLLTVSGCATPQYAMRPTPMPVETPAATQIEQAISQQQAREFDKLGSERVMPGERRYGFDLQGIIDRVSRVTERPNLPYRAFMYQDDDPNAASLADGRIYVSTGLLKYLASRGSREDELAFILGHEIGHTVAQHLVKRYQQLQREQVAMALVGLGTSAITRGGSARAAQLGQLAQQTASLVNQAIASGYSQDQELEADQLGMRYIIRAGYNPWQALEMVEDFKRFDRPSFLSTHPYTERRVEDLRHYLEDIGAKPGAGVPAAATMPSSFSPQLPAPAARPSARAQDDRRQRLLEAQKLYPVGSQSWKNIQSQLDNLR